MYDLADVGKVMILKFYRDQNTGFLAAIWTDHRQDRKGIENAVP